MTAAQASVGKAAAWPTTGTILMAALATRHGAAKAPQPDKNALRSNATTTDFLMAVEIEKHDSTSRNAYWSK